MCTYSYYLEESGPVQEKLFIVSSPSLAALPNYLHSGYLQIGVKAITEIPSLFLPLFSPQNLLISKTKVKAWNK